MNIKHLNKFINYAINEIIVVNFTMNTTNTMDISNFANELDMMTTSRYIYRCAYMLEQWDEYIAQMFPDKRPQPVANLHWLEFKHIMFFSFRYGDENPGSNTWYRDDGMEKGPFTAIPVLVVFDMKEERVIETRHVSDDPSGKVLVCGGDNYVVFYDDYYGSAYVYHPNGKYIGEVSMETRKQFPQNAVKVRSTLEEGEFVLKKQQTRRGKYRFLLETEFSADYLLKTPEFLWEPFHLKESEHEQKQSDQLYLKLSLG